MSNDSPKTDDGIQMMLRIADVLREKGMRRAELERITEISANRFSRWTKGVGFPNVIQAIAIADALQIPVRWLAGLQKSRGTEMYERAISDITKEIGEPEALRWLLGHPEIQGKIKRDDPSSLDHTWVLPNKMAFMPYLDSLGEIRNAAGERVDVIEHQKELNRRAQMQLEQEEARGKGYTADQAGQRAEEEGEGGAA